MDAEEQQHVENLLKQNRRRLRLLELRAAPFGTNAPAELVIEIQDIQATIDQLQERLNRSRRNVHLLPKIHEIWWPSLLIIATLFIALGQGHWRNPPSEVAPTPLPPVAILTAVRTPNPMPTMGTENSNLDPATSQGTASATATPKYSQGNVNLPYRHGEYVGSIKIPVDLRDFVLDFSFDIPKDPYFYTAVPVINFRSSQGISYRLYVDQNKGTWSYYFDPSRESPIPILLSPQIWNETSGLSNYVRLVAYNDTGCLYLNNKLAGTLDLSRLNQKGLIELSLDANYNRTSASTADSNRYELIFKEITVYENHSFRPCQSSE